MAVPVDVRLRIKGALGELAGKYVCDLLDKLNYNPDTGTLNLDVPTSSAGLAAGDLYTDTKTVKIT